MIGWWIGFSLSLVSPKSRDRHSVACVLPSNRLHSPHTRLKSVLPTTPPKATKTLPFLIITTTYTLSLFSLSSQSSSSSLVLLIPNFQNKKKKKKKTNKKAFPIPIPSIQTLLQSLCGFIQLFLSHIDRSVSHAF